jgi:hypothetical protein
MFNWLDYEVQNSEALTKAEKEYFFDQACLTFDSKKYIEVIEKYASDEVEDFFNDIKDLLTIRRCGKTSIDSPSYYNYRTDWLIFDAEIDKSEIQKIHDTVINDVEFFKWTDRYRSYSGFISFMPHDKSDYLRAIGGKDIERAVAMYITYIGEKNGYLTGSNKKNSYQENMEERISANNSYEDFLSDPKCLEMLDKIRAAG